MNFNMAFNLKAATEWQMRNTIRQFLKLLDTFFPTEIMSNQTDLDFHAKAFKTTNVGIQETLGKQK